MASLSAFNDLFGQFITELCKTFPQEKELKKILTGFEVMRSANPRKVLELFMTSILPVKEKIMARDESFFMSDEWKKSFKSEDVDVVASWIPIVKAHWTSASENTRDAIWQYLNTLIVVGSTIFMIPQETLGAIENIAEKCVNDMQSGGGSDLMSGLAGLMNAFASGGLPGLPGLPGPKK